ncbi:MAG: aspartate carbamoyltransferase regulatory subunit [Neisseria sp.]|nr:aspartate carbamoyltransferase regulatory subunit [Neisseria sp.]
MSENKQLSVEAIENGTVIDHIPAGLGLTILRQFKLLHHGSAVTVGFNLPSKRAGCKDIVKIKNVIFTQDEADRLALFAPAATVNIIEQFKVVNKLPLRLPAHIDDIFACPNPNCASHGEPVRSRFYVKPNSSQVKLKCHYCEKTFPRETLNEA